MLIGRLHTAGAKLVAVCKIHPWRDQCKVQCTDGSHSKRFDVQSVGHGKVRGKASSYYRFIP